MSYSYTNSSTDTYSESRARYVMGKIFDDFHAIAYRGFNYFERNPQKLQNWREDLLFLMTNQALEKFQIQFFANDGRKWALEYVISSDGSIHLDDDSGRIDYWEIPNTVSVGIVLSRDHSKKKVNDYMKERGWTSGGDYIEDELIDDGAYSKNGYGATKGRRGSWNQ